MYIFTGIISWTLLMCMHEAIIFDKKYAAILFYL